MNENTMDNMQPQQNSKAPTILAVVGIAVVIGIVAFVMMQNNGSPTTETILPPSQDSEVQIIEETEEATDEAMVGEDEAAPEIVEIEMEADSFFFDSDEITVNLGDTVRITLANVDDEMDHDFVLDELGVQSELIGPGETATIEFIADQVGEFEYYCSVGSHRQLGMVGTLTIEE